MIIFCLPQKKFLKQYLPIVNWTLKNTFSWHLNQNINLLLFSLRSCLHNISHVVNFIEYVGTARLYHCPQNETLPPLPRQYANKKVAAVSYVYIIHQSLVVIYASLILHVACWQVELPFLEFDTLQTWERYLIFDDVSSRYISPRPPEC